MKHLSLLKSIAMACCAMVAVAAVSSCSSRLSPKQAAARLQNSPDATVFSYNDASSPRARHCEEAGPLPPRAARALTAWLRSSTPKAFSYAYPQYYVYMANPSGRGHSVWGICSDGHGNLVGVLIPRSGAEAWNLPFTNEHTVYVCDGPQRKGLSSAVMESLADAGYDSFRIQSRKAMGLNQQQYLISKPLSDEAQKKYDLIKQAEEQAQAARAAKEAASVSGDSMEEASPASDDTSNLSSDEDLGLDF